MLKPAGRIAARALLRLLSRGDDWTRFASRLEPGAFGGDHTTPASALEVPLRSVASFEEFLERLAGFEKASGKEMGFGTASAAEAAAELEASGRGNCVAHASWAFAQLARLGYRPELVLGWWTAESADPAEFHAWVHFHRDGSDMLLEAMEPAPGRLVRPIAEARGDYVPLYAAAASGATFVYAALLRKRLGG